MAGFDWILYRVLDILKREVRGDFNPSYSQCGEDLIARFVFDTLRIPSPTYLDIGAHHPTYLNNTFIFYKQGGHGVNVEPDPELIARFQRQRSRDVNLNVGIGEREGEMPFYVMSVPTLNTFSESDARAIEREGKVRIERVVTLPVRPVNAVLSEYFPAGPDFFSLDVEGLDLAILRSIDFGSFRPKVICVETITYSEHRIGRKIPEIEAVLRDNDYFVYADTHINTVFVDRQIW